MFSKPRQKCFGDCCLCQARQVCVCLFACLYLCVCVFVCMWLRRWIWKESHTFSTKPYWINLKWLVFAIFMHACHKNKACVCLMCVCVSLQLMMLCTSFNGFVVNKKKGLLQCEHEITRWGLQEETTPTNKESLGNLLMHPRNLDGKG